VNPVYGGLGKDSVIKQTEASLKAMGIDSIDILYLHSPDINTGIEDTLQGISHLYESGKIKEFGLSNYPAWKVVDIFHRCDKMGTIKPSVYQGCYNAITRSMEFELIPALRELGMRQYNYNPLCGGLLTGKYKSFNDEAAKTDGRFGDKSPISGPAYSSRYWKKAYFKALDVIRVACEKAEISMSEAAIRWLMHHSALSPAHGDGIILGASSIGHCVSNLAACAEGPLPPEVLSAYDEAWEITSSVADSYFRGYGSAPGISDHFLQMHQSDRVPNY